MAWMSAPGISAEIRQPNLICLIDVTWQNAPYEPGVVMFHSFCLCNFIG